MSSWAKPGVKCVRINDPNPNGKWKRKTGAAPIKGVVYTIIEARINSTDGGLLLVFKEIPDAGGNYGWSVKNFAPLTTRTQEQDVALFAPLLTATLTQPLAPVRGMETSRSD